MTTTNKKKFSSNELLIKEMNSNSKIAKAKDPAFFFLIPRPRLQLIQAKINAVNHLLNNSLLVN